MKDERDKESDLKEIVEIAEIIKDDLPRREKVNEADHKSEVYRVARACYAYIITRGIKALAEYAKETAYTPFINAVKKISEYLKNRNKDE